MAATVYMMIGIPGSGKTTYAQSQLHNAVYIGTDAIRYELYGREMTVRGRKKVYDLLRKRLRIAVKNEKDVVLDCANTTLHRRKKILRMIPGHCRIIGIWMRTPLQYAIRNNRKRNRHVPVGGIFLMWLFFQQPSSAEGFDKIKAVSRYGSFSAKKERPVELIQ